RTVARHLAGRARAGRCGRHARREFGLDPRLLDQVRGVLGEDAVAEAEGADLLDQLGRTSLEADLAAQLADPARGPELRHVAVLRGVARKGRLDGEPLTAAVAGSLDDDGAAAAALVARQHDEFLAEEE